ncbi:MAG: hypothetical protein ACJAYR_001002 [Sneathiella sp.]|jgi:hypothetical protein
MQDAGVTYHSIDTCFLYGGLVNIVFSRFGINCRITLYFSPEQAKIVDPMLTQVRRTLRIRMTLNPVPGPCKPLTMATLLIKVSASDLKSGAFTIHWLILIGWPV